MAQGVCRCVVVGVWVCGSVERICFLLCNTRGKYSVCIFLFLFLFLSLRAAGLESCHSMREMYHSGRLATVISLDLA